MKLQILDSGRVSLIGNRGWLARDGKRARFDQQPVEAMAMAEACAEAYRVTKQEVWFDRARTFLDWFTGNNDTGSSLYDYQTGGCRDGLHADGPNLNQGAESTLAWLIALLTMMDVHRSRALEQDGRHSRRGVIEWQRAGDKVMPLHARLGRSTMSATAGLMMSMPTIFLFAGCRSDSKATTAASSFAPLS